MTRVENKNIRIATFSSKFYDIVWLLPTIITSLPHKHFDGVYTDKEYKYAWSIEIVWLHWSAEMCIWWGRKKEK